MHFNSDALGASSCHRYHMFIANGFVSMGANLCDGILSPSAFRSVHRNDPSPPSSRGRMPVNFCETIRRADLNEGVVDPEFRCESVLIPAGGGHYADTSKINSRIHRHAKRKGWLDVTPSGRVFLFRESRCNFGSRHDFRLLRTFQKWPPKHAKPNDPPKLCTADPKCCRATARAVTAARPKPRMVRFTSSSATHTSNEFEFAATWEGFGEKRGCECCTAAKEMTRARRR